MPLDLWRTTRTFRCHSARAHLYTTESVNELIDFGISHDLLMTWKLDGQPILLIYDKGHLQSAIICDDGITGYDITTQARQIEAIPKTIFHTGSIKVYGTAVLSWQQYNKIAADKKEKLPQPKKLISSVIKSVSTCADMGPTISFLAYNTTHKTHLSDKTQLLKQLYNWGFEIPVYRQLSKGITYDQVKQLQRLYSPFESRYPVSGLVFETVSFQPAGTEDIMALRWPYDVHGKIYVGTIRLYHDLFSEE